MADVVDLTFSDSEEEKTPDPKQKAEEAAQAKKRIMDFAKNVAANKRTKLPDLPASTSPIKGSSSADAPADAPAAAQGSTADAAAAATAAGGSTHPAGAAPGASDAGAAAASISNADLRSLHEARMRRMQQQQPAGTAQDATQDAAAGSEQPNLNAAAGAAAGTNSTAAGAKAAAGAAGAAGRSGPKGSGSPTVKPGSPSSRQKSANGAGVGAGTGAAAAAAGASAGSGGSKSISLLTYNVWFKEDVAVFERMMGIGDIITQAGLPTFICLQEVTPFILELLSNMAWWSAYVCSPHPYDATYFTLLLVNKAAVPGITSGSFREKQFDNSVMARSLRSVTATIGGHPLLVATSHLESPTPPQAFYSKERKEQMAQALQVLEAGAAGNVLFAGDMNWTDERDGAPPLPSDWCDAWKQLQPGKPGLTYDGKSNPMLPYKGLGLRLDRIFCKLRDWRLKSVRMVGTEPLEGVTYTHTFRNGGSKQLPVLPSDHFGLLLQLEEV